MRQTTKNNNTIVAFLLENTQDPQWTDFAYKLKVLYSSFLNSQGFSETPLILKDPHELNELPPAALLVFDWRKSAYLTSVYLPEEVSSSEGLRGLRYSTNPTPTAKDSLVSNRVFFFPQGASWPTPGHLKPWLLGGCPFTPKALRAKGEEALLTHAREYLESFRPALFLDRDGVLIEDTRYPHKPEDFLPNPEIIPLIHWARDKDHHVFVITNQAGLARGIFSLEEYRTFTKQIRRWLRNHKAQPDCWSFCPYHPGGTMPPWIGESFLRKPHPGMALKLSSKFAIDWPRSLMIGDKASDILEGLPLTTYLVPSHYDLSTSGPRAQIFKQFSDLLKFLKKGHPLP